jgi:hypothetical protein
LVYLLITLLAFYVLQTTRFRAVAGGAGARLQPSWLYTSAFVTVSVGLGVALLIAALQGVLTLLLNGVVCPQCFKRGLERVAVRSFGPRYFRCPSCGSRLKRNSFAVWESVTSPEEGTLFDPAQRESSFVIDPWDEEEIGLGVKSIDSLLRNHRRRKHSN